MHHARIFGYPVPDIQFSTSAIGSGEFDWEHTLRIDPLEVGFDLSRSVFGTAAHEAMHVHQDKLRDDLVAGKIDTSDARYPLAEIMRYNQHFYRPLRDKEGNYHLVDYRREPLEKEAEAFANRFREALRAKWLTESGGN